MRWVICEKSSDRSLQRKQASEGEEPIPHRDGLIDPESLPMQYFQATDGLATDFQLPF